MNSLDAITDYLRDDLIRCGHGRLYTAADLAAAASERGAHVDTAGITDAIRQAGGIRLHYRGGNTGVGITFDAPNRSATLQRVDTGVFSFDTEAAVQNGLAEWFRRRGWVVRQEVSDDGRVIAGIAQAGSLDHLPAESRSRSTACRDLMAHAPNAPLKTFHILEVKGLTQLETDFYETFGQIFPINDAAVTRGWTINKVPKHGRCLKYARRFREVWSVAGAESLITLVVVVPDLPPLHFDPTRFHDGPTLYYPTQVGMYRKFLTQHTLYEDHVFARLLLHLRDRYRLLDMLAATGGIAFRFWGYQGLNWVRDFATNQPVTIGAKTPQGGNDKA